MSNNFHTSVLLKESLDFLDVKPDQWYVDCNLGGGGHTQAILERGGKVLGIDLDSEAINEVSQKHQLEINTGRLILVQANFTQVGEIIAEHAITPAGILYDLGVSSHQLDTSERGFSFSLGGPLDMRMDPTQGIPAADLVNGLHEGELTTLFQKYGEESFAKPIAKKIIQTRKLRTIRTAEDLANIVASAYPRSNKSKIHPATKVFQALRIAVNDEINSLEQSLPSAFEILSPDGRLVVISFHSLEDRIVKNYFRDLVSQNVAEQLTKKPLIPTDEEITRNPRSRSAKLRAIQKLD